MRQSASPQQWMPVITNGSTAASAPDTRSITWSTGIGRSASEPARPGSSRNRSTCAPGAAVRASATSWRARLADGRAGDRERDAGLDARRDERAPDGDGPGQLHLDRAGATGDRGEERAGAGVRRALEPLVGERGGRVERGGVDPHRPVLVDRHPVDAPDPLGDDALARVERRERRRGRQVGGAVEHEGDGLVGVAVRQAADPRDGAEPEVGLGRDHVGARRLEGWRRLPLRSPVSPPREWLPTVPVGKSQPVASDGRPTAGAGGEPGPWAFRVAWIVLPFTAGPLLSDALVADRRRLPAHRHGRACGPSGRSRSRPRSSSGPSR